MNEREQSKQKKGQTEPGRMDAGKSGTAETKTKKANAGEGGRTGNGGSGNGGTETVGSGKPSRLKLLVRDCLPAAAVLLAIPLLALWNARTLSVRGGRWQEQLDAVERHVRAGAWEDARAALEAGRADWSAARVWLQITARHDEVERADILYERCAVLAEEAGFLLPELGELRRVLDDLADRERLTPGNIL